MEKNQTPKKHLQNSQQFREAIKKSKSLNNLRKEESIRDKILFGFLQVKCEYCSQEFPDNEINLHVLECISQNIIRDNQNEYQYQYQQQQTESILNELPETKSEVASEDELANESQLIEIDGEMEVEQQKQREQEKALMINNLMGYPDEEFRLEGCDFCGRKFSSEIIEKHTKFCQKKAGKVKRQVFNSKMQRQAYEQQKYQQKQLKNENIQDYKVINQENNPLFDCTHCGRKFSKHSIEKHVKICQKVFKKSRKVFDSKRQRLDEFKNEQYFIKKEQEQEQISQNQESIKNQKLAKCMQCGRNFNDKYILRHTILCQKQVQKTPSKKFDSKSQRIESNSYLIKQIEKQKEKEQVKNIDLIPQQQQNFIPRSIQEQINSLSVKKYALLQSEIGFDRVEDKIKMTGNSLKFMKEVLIGYLNYSRDLEKDKYLFENIAWVVNFQKQLCKPYLEKVFLDIVDIWVDRYIVVFDNFMIGKQYLLRKIVLEWNFSRERKSKILDLLWKMYDKYSSYSQEQASNFQSLLIERLENIQLKSQKEVNYLQFVNQLIQKQGFSVFGNKQEKLLQALCKVYDLGHSVQRSMVSDSFSLILKQTGEVLVPQIKKIDYSVYQRCKIFEKKSIKKVFKSLQKKEKEQFIFFGESVVEMKEEKINVFQFENEGQEEVNLLWIEDALTLYIAEDNIELCQKIVKDAKKVENVSVLWNIVKEYLNKFDNFIVISKIQEILEFFLEQIDKKARKYNQAVLSIFESLIKQFGTYCNSNSFISILVLMNEKGYVEDQKYWIDLANIVKRYEENEGIIGRIYYILERSQMQKLYQKGCKGKLEKIEAFNGLSERLSQNLDIVGCNSKVRFLNFLAVILFQFQEDLGVVEKIGHLVVLRADIQKVKCNLVKIGLKYANLLKKSGEYKKDLKSLLQEKQIWEKNLVEFGVTFKMF